MTSLKKTRYSLTISIWKTLENFDAGMCDQLIKRVVKNESYTVDITACGLYTLKFIGLSKLK